MSNIQESKQEALLNVNEENSLLEITDAYQIVKRSGFENKKVLSVPIAELSTLGAGVSSLIPAFNTVTHTITIPVDGVYTIANARPGDFLKTAKNGNAWGALKNADGGSRLVQLQKLENLQGSAQTVAALNPTTILMSAALYSIEQELGKIEEKQQEILSFLEVEKESEIEADVDMLMAIIQKYKMNWENEHFLASNHKMVLDIQRTARKNMLSYQKIVCETIEKKHRIVAHNKVTQTYIDFEKKFKYYWLSLYSFSFASMLEIMLSGNFNEEYVAGIKNELVDMSQTYRELFARSSLYLEKLGSSAVDTNVLKGVGAAGKAVGKFIGSIPLIKEGPVDELLQDTGAKLEENMKGAEKQAVYNFASLSNPATSVFIDKMGTLIQIYDHTEEICADEKKIYLIAS
ncbi:MAG: hypothetical protein Q4B26_11275 [Eubacteriales bacterium]|nr:hypothetical protein [Eubacteriales bacterium]